MAFMDFLFGQQAATQTKPIYDPGQENILDQLLGGVGQQLPQGLKGLQSILGGEGVETLEAPSRRAFEQKTLPTIAERFTGSFGEGSQRSSAFGQALGTAGRELEENLSAQRTGLQSGALGQLLSLLGPALSPRRHEFTTPRQPGFLENLLVALAQGGWRGGRGATGGLK